MSENENKKKAGPAALLAGMSPKMKAIAAAVVLALIAAAAGISGLFGNGNSPSAGTELIGKFWPDAFVVKADDEPAFDDDPDRTNNAFNVIDFGAQGSNGWFYRYGDYKKPDRSHRVERFDGEKYFQPGANGFEIKSGFVHTADKVSPILEWRAAKDGRVNVTLAYVKNVNGDANPSYPDGVQLLIYKGKELLKFEIVPISVTEENYALLTVDDLEIRRHESLYFVVNPGANNAYDGGSLYAAVSDVNQKQKTPVSAPGNNNNANSTEDFGEQGSNGWRYMYGTEPADLKLVSHEHEGEYINALSPALCIKKDFIHPSLAHDAVLAWQPAVSGIVDVRLRYTKFEQNDGNPDFPDGTRIRIFKNGECIYDEHADVKQKGEILIKKRIPMLSVTPMDMLYFMVGAEGNSSYDGGALDVTIIDINGTSDENSVVTESDEIRQNFADVKDDFGPQGSNGWIFQSGYGDDPFNARNMAPFDKTMDRYFADNWLEIKRDYVNTGEHDSSAVIKWKVAQNGTISIRASYTKMKNEDKNPSWPDGTRVSLYVNNTLLARQTFEPFTDREVTKRLDVSSLNVLKGQYITMVVNGIDNNAYDGGKYEFAISSLSGLVGNNENNVPASPADRTNFASTLDDFGEQGTNGWYYQYGYNHDPYCAVNVEKFDGDKYYTNDGIEIKKDYIVPAANGKAAIVKWIAAETGTVNIDLLYTKLLNEDANPSWPDGVTVYLMKNGTVLKQQYFEPLTDREVTGDLSAYGVQVNKGDMISMIVDPGENAAYDGGKYLFVIEDADKTPSVKTGNNDNSTSLAALDSIEQGADGWWFLEGTEPSDAKVLTKKIDDGTGYGSRRSEGLVMKKDFVHTGNTLDPIYQWLAGEDGKVDITGTYIKFGEEDANPSWPDGVTVKIWHNDRLLFRQKVNVRHGDGNNNAISFSFDKLTVKRGDKLSFQICADNNYAWDGGALNVAIEPSSTLVMKPGNDNRTNLWSLESVEQGTDGWYFMEGTSLANAKPLSKLTDDGWGYVSVKDSGLEMKKDYVHTGSVQNPIYRWVVKDDGEINISGSYVKFGQNDANPSYPDGITLIIYHNNDVLLSEAVEVKQGDGNDTVLNFRFDKLAVKADDIISFRINPNGNNAWDGGKLSVLIGDAADDEEVEPDPERTNNTVLKDAFGRQGSDGWYYGMCDWNSANFEKLPYDASNNRYYNSGKPELKADFVEPGQGRNAAYKWVAAEDGTIYITGEYVKFANSADANADGTCVRIFLNGEEKQWYGSSTMGNFAQDRTEAISNSFDVKAGDEIIFAINPEGNDSYDGGRLAIRISDHEEEEQPDDPERTNNTVLKDAFGEQGSDGWHYGMCDWDSKNFEELTYDAENSRYYNNGKPELKADFVEPGQGRNAAYKWVAARKGTIYVTGEYVKFANSEDPAADGTCVRIFINGEEKKWMGSNTMGNFSEERNETFNETYEVKAGDELIFAVNPEGNDSYDGGRLSVTISDHKEDEEPERTNNTVLKDAFGEQGSDGWHYGMCEWDSKNFEELTYDAAEQRYYNNGKPELKADFVEPGNGKNAAYKWIAAADGTIYVKGEYVKFANADDPNADGTCVRIFVNGEEKKWMGSNTMGNFSEERNETFNETYEVKAGDEIIFAVNPEGNDSYDGGRLSVTISDKAETEPEPSPEPERTNNTVLKDAFGEQGSDGWHYGMCEWDSKNFEELTYDTENSRYYNNGKPELKADFVEPGNGKNAAYKWIAAADGTIYVKGEYVKFANADDPNADGTCVRIFVNGEEKKWMGSNTMGNFSEERNEIFNESYEVKAGDEIIFAVNPEGNDSYDGGRLSVTISDQPQTDPQPDPEPQPEPSPEPEPTPEPVPERTNNTVLKDAFGEQGNDGWHFGMCEWDSKNFEELAYDAENNRYYNNGKPELKADFVEPGNGKNAAYKWIAAADGTIQVKGEYVKFANADDPNADGTCVRIFINGEEKKWMGSNTMGNFSEERSDSFDEIYEVKAGDEIIFAINPEGNDSYDGGRLSVSISAK